MTIVAGSAVSATPWMSRAELAQASGLREDLVARFIPATETPNGPMYPAHQLALAVYVKELTDHNVPPAAVEDKIREFTSRPPAAAPYVSPAARRTVSRRSLWTAVGGAAATALVLGGVVGGLIGSSSKGDNSTSAPSTVTVEAAAPQLNPTIPTSPDPVCAEWGPSANAYTAEQLEWGKTDPNIPGSAWTPEQQTLSAQVASVMRDQAADMKRMADKAKDPFLASLMRAQAHYEETFASRLGPGYQPSDHSYWEAAVSYSSAVRSTCLTVTPK